MSDPTQPGTFLRPVSAQLARVLAQAANSSYAPATLYIVARYDPDPAMPTTPYDVRKPFATYEDAQDLVARLGQEYGVFGPFQNTGGSVGQLTVGNLVITLNGSAVSITIDGQDYDALFYSIQAVEKFVVPYCVQEYGPEFGSLVLNEFRESSVALMGHLPWSEEVQVVDPVRQGPSRSVPVSFHVFRRDAGDTIRKHAVTPPAPGQA